MKKRANSNNINIVECKKLWYYNTYKSDEYDTFHKDLILLGALMSVTNMDDVDKCLGDIDATLKIKELIKEVIINMNNNDDAWGRWYDRNEENERMAQSNLDFAHKQGVKEGIVIGRDEGIVIGRDEGIVIGRGEGIEIGSKKKEREMVINLNKQGVSLDIISISSGLTIPEIEAIINNQDNKN